MIANDVFPTATRLRLNLKNTGRKSAIIPHSTAATALRLGGLVVTFSQRSSFLATLGWRLESRWDSEL
jgi:hypothetical protein